MYYFLKKLFLISCVIKLLYANYFSQLIHTNSKKLKKTNITDIYLAIRSISNTINQNYEFTAKIKKFKISCALKVFLINKSEKIASNK